MPIRLAPVVLTLAALTACGEDDPPPSPPPPACDDADGDTICDDVDPCPADAMDDSDGDGSCDSVDLCTGDDSTADTDGDGVCDDLDVCEGDDATGDADQDGLCADTDNCDDRFNPDQLDLCDIYFVDASARGAGDGSSWADAFTSIQDAVDAGGEVWVAAGTYRASEGVESLVKLGEGSRVYGGFDGTELSLAERAGRFESTILTADVNGDDDGSVASVDDNAGRGVEFGQDSLIDGFAIEGGNQRIGAALYVAGATGAVGRNLSLRNHLLSGANLVQIDDASLRLENIVVVDNEFEGGPMFEGGGVSNLELVNGTIARSNGASSLFSAGSSGAYDVAFLSVDVRFAGPNLFRPNLTTELPVGSTLRVRNSILYGLFDNRGATSVEHTAMDQDPGSYGLTNEWLANAGPESSDPYVRTASGPLFLAQVAAGDGFTSFAVDTGDNAAADITLPNWQALSTRRDLGPDSGTVDPGAHYDPQRPVIVSVGSDATDLFWTTLGATSCTLDGVPVAIDGSAPLATSRQLLVCTNAAGDAAIRR